MSKPHPWTTKDAEEYYGFKRWGGNNFSVDPQGHLCVHPKGDHRKIRITDIVKEVEAAGLKPPLTIRVQDLLRHRVTQINEAFRSAIKEEDYAGRYRGVFPIKVNQLREVVEETATELDGMDIKLAYVPVTPTNRFEKVRSGEVDLECGSTTNSVQRQKEVAFSPIFFAVSSSAPDSRSTRPP